MVQSYVLCVFTALYVSLYNHIPGTFNVLQFPQWNIISQKTSAFFIKASIAVTLTVYPLVLTLWWRLQNMNVIRFTSASMKVLHRQLLVWLSLWIGSKCNYTQEHTLSLSFGYFVKDCGNTHRCYYNQYITKKKTGTKWFKKARRPPLNQSVQILSLQLAWAGIHFKMIFNANVKKTNTWAENHFKNVDPCYRCGITGPCEATLAPEYKWIYI